MTTAPANTGDVLLGWGLRIASAIPLPGAMPIPAGCPGSTPTSAQVEVVLGASCAPESWPDLYRWDGAALDFAPPGVARFRITPTTIHVQPHPAADTASVTGLLVATAFPALLWLRGQFVLHAAALALPGSGQTMAIAGPSGAGKSALARWFADRGAGLVADDSLAICPLGDPPVGCGLSGGMWLGPPDRRQFVDFEQADRHDQSTGLGTVVVLTRGAELTLRPLQRLDAFAALLQNRHRPRVPSVIGRQQAVMDQANALCRRVRCYELLFDKKHHSPQELGELLEQNFGKGPAHR